MTWPKDIPFDPARKRYYLVGPDYNPSQFDYRLLNEEEAFPQGMAGTREYQIPGRRHPDRYGLPIMGTRPRLFVASDDQPRDAYGYQPPFYISTRAKELLCRIDAEAFELAECETVSGKGIRVQPYWMMGIVRPVEAFDEERSVFEWNEGIDGMTHQPYVGPYFWRLYDIHMLPDLSEDFHAFFFPRLPRQFVVDQVLADEWRALRFSGWAFTPLQPPARNELTLGIGGSNFLYWSRK